jgi:hypothetical protein
MVAKVGAKRLPREGPEARLAAKSRDRSWATGGAVRAMADVEVGAGRVVRTAASIGAERRSEHRISRVRGRLQGPCTSGDERKSLELHPFGQALPGWSTANLGSSQSVRRVRPGPWRAPTALQGPASWAGATPRTRRLADTDKRLERSGANFPFTLKQPVEEVIRRHEAAHLHSAVPRGLSRCLGFACVLGGHRSEKGEPPTLEPRPQGAASSPGPMARTTWVEP